MVHENAMTGKYAILTTFTLCKVGQSHLKGTVAKLHKPFCKSKGKYLKENKEKRFYFNQGCHEGLFSVSINLFLKKQKNK